MKRQLNANLLLPEPLVPSACQNCLGPVNDGSSTASLWIDFRQNCYEKQLKSPRNRLLHDRSGPLRTLDKAAIIPGSFQNRQAGSLAQKSFSPKEYGEFFQNLTVPAMCGKRKPFAAAARGQEP